MPNFEVFFDILPIFSSGRSRKSCSFSQPIRFTFLVHKVSQKLSKQSKSDIVALGIAEQVGCLTVGLIFVPLLVGLRISKRDSTRLMFFDALMRPFSRRARQVHCPSIGHWGKPAMASDSNSADVIYGPVLQSDHCPSHVP